MSCVMLSFRLSVGAAIAAPLLPEAYRLVLDIGNVHGRKGQLAAGGIMALCSFLGFSYPADHCCNAVVQAVAQLVNPESLDLPSQLDEPLIS